MKFNNILSISVLSVLALAACNPIEDTSLRDKYFTNAGTPITTEELDKAISITQPYTNQEGVAEGDQIVEELNALVGSALRLAPVVNRFFGAVTTVSGLLTGRDVVAALQNRFLGDLVLLPRAMFTGSYGAGSAPPDATLDDMSLAGISDRLGVPAAMAGSLTEALAALTADP